MHRINQKKKSQTSINRLLWSIARSKLPPWPQNRYFSPHTTPTAFASYPYALSYVHLASDTVHKRRSRGVSQVVNGALLRAIFSVLRTAICDKPHGHAMFRECAKDTHTSDVQMKYYEPPMTYANVGPDAGRKLIRLRNGAPGVIWRIFYSTRTLRYITGGASAEF